LLTINQSSLWTPKVDIFLELVVKLLIIGFLLFFGIKVMPYLFKEFVLKDFFERTETKIRNYQP
jgi:hypothetical protein